MDNSFRFPSVLIAGQLFFPIAVLCIPLTISLSISFLLSMASPSQSHPCFKDGWHYILDSRRLGPNSIYFGCKYRGKNGTDKNIKDADFEAFIPQMLIIILQDLPG